MYRLSPLLLSATDLILTQKKNNVGIVTFNRPQQMNALSREVCDSLIKELIKHDNDPEVAAIIITGSGKAFVAGADIKEMLKYGSYAKAATGKNAIQPLRDHLHKISKPIIAAVNGYALGGGCEIAMACDIIVASEKAKFGQPEINIGILPGLGGTQRLPRAIGKHRAMEWTLTGWKYTAEEAERAGLVTRVVKDEELMPMAIKIAQAIGKNSHVTAKLMKKSVNASQETTLELGLLYEKDLCDTAFATEDRIEGMTAFVEKRPANFKNR